MTGSRSLLLACFLSFIAINSNAQHSATQSVVSLTPAIVEAGSPELIVISTPNAKSISGEWLGRKLEFFQRGQKWVALAGVDVEGAAGPSTLQISAQLDNGRPLDLSQTIEIHPAHYRTGTLTVPPKFVEPGPEELKVIAADAELKTKVFASSAAEPLWRGNFRAPVRAAANRQLRDAPHVQWQAGQHSQGHGFSRARWGLWFARPTAASWCWRGRSTTKAIASIIDHGLGLYTVSMHFSRIDVHEGQRVAHGRQAGTERRHGSRDRTASALGCALGRRLS